LQWQDIPENRIRWRESVRKNFLSPYSCDPKAHKLKFKTVRSHLTKAAAFMMLLERLYLDSPSEYIPENQRQHHSWKTNMVKGVQSNIWRVVK
jgi:hypothetical protein